MVGSAQLGGATGGARAVAELAGRGRIKGFDTDGIDRESKEYAHLPVQEGSECGFEREPFCREVWPRVWGAA